MNHEREFSQEEMEGELPVVSAQEQMTVVQLNKLVEDLAAKRAEKDKLENEVTLLNKEIGAKESTIVKFMEENQMERYISPIAQLSIDLKWRVSMPQGDNKAVLFNHLKERDIFEGLATIHAQSLQSLWKEDFAAAKARGDLTWQMPGVGAPKLFKQLKLTLNKINKGR